MALIENGKFTEYRCNLEQGYSCCGQGIFWDFLPKANNKFIEDEKGRRFARMGFETQQEQLDALYEFMVKRYKTDLDGYNEDAEYDEDQKESLYGLFSLTVTEDQIPGFIDYLKAKGWEVMQNAVNPKTGNMIYNMGTYEL